MTALETAVLTAALRQAKSISQTQIVEVLIGLILADASTRDAFVKQAAADAAVETQTARDAVDTDAAAKKKSLDDTLAELQVAASAEVAVAAIEEIKA